MSISIGFRDKIKAAILFKESYLHRVVFSSAPPIVARGECMAVSFH